MKIMLNRENKNENKKSSTQDATISFEIHALFSEASSWSQFEIDEQFFDISFMKEIE